MKPLFELGQVVMTSGVAALVAEDPYGPQLLDYNIKRHASGDWGNVPKEDKEENDFAVRHGNRILSSYMLGPKKIWVITESDRSSTTVLFPEEY